MLLSYGFWPEIDEERQFPFETAQTSTISQRHANPGHRSRPGGTIIFFRQNNYVIKAILVNILTDVFALN
jgi:hypothetical protein